MPTIATQYYGNPANPSSGKVEPEVLVVIGDNSRPLYRRDDLDNLRYHQYAWGSEEHNDGACILAIALLADAVDDKIALEQWYQFRTSVLLNIPADEPWVMTQDQIVDWCLGNLDAFKTDAAADQVDGEIIEDTFGATPEEA